MNRTPDGALRPIQEQVNPCDVLVNETNRLRGVDYAFEVLAPDQNVHILRVSHRLDVNAATQAAIAFPPTTACLIPARSRAAAIRIARSRTASTAAIILSQENSLSLGVIMSSIPAATQRDSRGLLLASPNVKTNRPDEAGGGRRTTCIVATPGIGEKPPASSGRVQRFGSIGGDRSTDHSARRNRRSLASGSALGALPHNNAITDSPAS